MTLTIKEAAAKLGVGITTVHNHLRRGKLPGAVKTGKSWEIPESAIKAFLNPPPKKYMSIKEVAEKTGLAGPTIHMHLKKGRFPKAKKVLNAWQIPNGDIGAFLDLEFKSGRDSSPRGAMVKRDGHWRTKDGKKVWVKGFDYRDRKGGFGHGNKSGA